MDLEEVKDLLECPVCFDTINSVPIYQCRNGHVVCKNCHPKLETCPICRQLHDGPRNLKLEEMVERLQLSLSEGTKKLASESIQIDPIVPETPNLHRDTNQETRQAADQLNIVENDEYVTSEPRLIGIFFGIISALIVCGMLGGYFYLISYLLSLHTKTSVIFGGILLFPIFLVYACAKCAKDLNQ